MATVFSATVAGTSTGWASRTQRNVTVTALLSGSLGQVRVTFKAESSSVLIADHCSIGVATGTQADIVGSFNSATFQELKFSGISGVNIGAGATITSDWVSLTFSISDVLVVVLDYNAGMSTTSENSSAVGNIWYKDATASYNQTATPSGSSSLASEWNSISLIETQGTATAGGASFGLGSVITKTVAIGY